MRAVLHDIQDGTFARNWILENQAGCPGLQTMRRNDAQHPIEEIARKIHQETPEKK
jgi:ketol-acid reductoisomerase